MFRRTLPALLLFAGIGYAQDVNDATEKAMKEAAAKVAPCIARIETTGGAEAIWGAGRKGPEVMFRRGTGATTGLVVDPNGYVITSSFNFIGKPTDIFVTVPGKPRVVAKVVGTDTTRMLTMLKFEQTGLPMPTPFPKKDVEVGMWSIALGRTLNPELSQPPSINGGIVSATNRVWGKAIQSDAKISPVNYGGPLIAIDGRVMGVIVPISPSSEGETAGFEWYDVGIGFAVPLEDVMRVVPKLKEGTPEKPVTLRPGLMGITFREPDQYTMGITVDTIAPETPADKIGMKVGDNIVEAEGKPVLNQAQLLHLLRPKYEGDTISIKVKRGDKIEEYKDIKLAAQMSNVDPGFLGVLLMRDDPELGAEVRVVFPKSAAEKAGLQPGDRIMKIGARQVGPKPKIDPKTPMPPGAPPTGPQPFSGRDQFMERLQNFRAGQAITMEVTKKDGKAATIDAVLGQFPDEIPSELPKEKSSKEKALVAPKPVGPMPMPVPMPKKEEPKKEEPKKEEPKKEDAKKEEGKKDETKTGLQKIENAGSGQRNFWVFVPDNYDPNVSHGLIVWLHPAERGGGRDADDMVKVWDVFCERHHFIMIGPTAGQPTGWVAGEADAVMDDVRWVRTRYTIDSKRVIAHGQGVGGQMAYYLGINKREVIRGVAAVGAVLASNPKDPVSNQRVEFLVIGGAKDPLVKEIQEAPKKLTEKKYKALYREMKITGKEYVYDDLDVFSEMIRWMDSLDKQ